MSKYKLVLSSIKNQIHIYSIYIVSLIFSFTFYLTFINLSISVIEGTKNYELQTKIYTISAYLMGILFAILIILLINYVQTLLINARSKEFAVYRLVSFSAKELRKYLLVEQLIINTVAFIIAVVLSLILSTILIDNFNTTVESLLSIKINLSLSLGAIVYEVLSLLLISILVTRFTTRKIEKKELIDLLNTKLALPNDTSNTTSLLNIIIVFATWVGLIFILTTQLGHLKYQTIAAILVIYIISIFTIYNVVAKLIVKLIPNKIYYKGTNSFTASIIKRKLTANAISMAFVTILIVISTFTLTFGVINTKYISYLAMYDDVSFNTDYTSIPLTYKGNSYNFDYYCYYFPEYTINLNDNYVLVSEYSYNAFANENNFETIDLNSEQAVVLSTNADKIPNNLVMSDKLNNNYNLTVENIVSVDSNDKGSLIIIDDSYNVDTTKYIDNFYAQLVQMGTNPIQNRFKGIDAKLYKDGTKISDYLNIMSESIANEYLNKLGFDERINVQSNQMAYIGTLPYSVEDNYTLVTSDNTFNLTQVITGPGLESFGFGQMVLSDEAYNQIDGYSIEYIEASYTDKYDEKYWVEFDASGVYPSWISTISARNTLMLVTNVMFSGALIFISLIMLLLLITMIGVQVNIDSLETKEQFKSLSRIGYSKKNIHSVINKITTIYFIIPLIIGIINIILLFVVFNKYFIDYTTTSLIFSTGAVSMRELGYICLFMLLIYILYCILVNISYKRVIDKNYE